MYGTIVGHKWKEEMSNRFVLILIACIVAFAGIFWFTKKDKDKAAPATSAQPTNHIQGEGKTGVTFVEYGDYQCPFCGQYYPVVKQTQAKYNEEITFQFINLPLT